MTAVVCNRGQFQPKQCRWSEMDPSWCNEHASYRRIPGYNAPSELGLTVKCGTESRSIKAPLDDGELDFIVQGVRQGFYYQELGMSKGHLVERLVSTILHLRRGGAS